MKKGFTSLFLLVFCIIINAQTLDKIMMEQREPLCSEISNNASKLFANYMMENKLDSALQVLTYWKDKCETSEPIFRAQTLLDLFMGTFNEYDLTPESFNHLIQYCTRQKIKADTYSVSQQRHSERLDYIPLGKEFDTYTLQLAQQLRGRYKEGTSEFLLVEFYNNNTDLLFEKLQTKEYAPNYLSKLYMNIIDYYKKIGDINMAFITGIWIPTGALSQMGVHPELGYQMGFKKNRMNYDLTMTLKLLNTPNSYWALRNNIKEETNHFLGGYIGFDVGYDIYTQGKHEIQINSGIAADGFDMLKEDKNRDLKSVTNFNFNFNLGAGYRFYITQNTYIGFKAKYNMVDYTSNNNFFIKGQPITLHVSIGVLSGGAKYGVFNALHYKFRK